MTAPDFPPVLLPPMLTPKDVAAYLQVSRAQSYALCATMPHIKITSKTAGRGAGQRPREARRLPYVARRAGSVSTWSKRDLRKLSVLVKRADFLQDRIEERTRNGEPYNWTHYNAQEYSALKWALNRLGVEYPEECEPRAIKAEVYTLRKG